MVNILWNIGKICCSVPFFRNFPSSSDIDFDRFFCFFKFDREFIKQFYLNKLIFSNYQNQYFYTFVKMIEIIKANINLNH